MLYSNVRYIFRIIDEGYFTVESSEIEKVKGRRGRGVAGKQNAD